MKGLVDGVGALLIGYIIGGFGMPVWAGVVSVLLAVGLWFLFVDTMFKEEED